MSCQAIGFDEFIDSAVIHQHCPGPVGTITMGFPCQPFSKQLLVTLDMQPQIIFLIQPQSAILECVISARESPEIQRQLQLLANMMGWDVLQIKSSRALAMAL